MITDTTTDNALQELGFSLEILSGPTGDVTDKWVNIAYTVRLNWNGRAILETPYKLGVGHVTLPDKPPTGWTGDEISMLLAWQRKPSADFVDKELQARVAAKLAKQQKVVPTLSGVLYGLLSDGSAFFDAVSFEEWASEFGYDPDSRKAEAIYRQCDAIGRKLSKIPADKLSAAREVLADY